MHLTVNWGRPTTPSRTLLPLLLLSIFDSLCPLAPQIFHLTAASTSLGPPENIPWAQGLQLATTNTNRLEDDPYPRKRHKRVNIPFFVDHLIKKQQHHDFSSQHAEEANFLEHDHTLHKPGHCRQSMQIENSICDYDAVEKVNDEMRVQLKAIVQQKFFRYYKLNLYESCPFWTENHLCMNPDCGVATVDESNIPLEWTSAALGALASPKNGKLFQPFKSCNLKDQDFCQVDDEASSEGVYVDLIANPERFTGYAGPSAAKVWGAIYNENCFNVAQRMQLASDCEQCSLDRESEAEELKELLQSAASTGFSLAQDPAMVLSVRPEPSHSHDHHDRSHPLADSKSKSPSTASHDTSMGFDPANPLTVRVVADDEICLEKRVFYRMISGLHASISIHICDEYLNQSTGVWGPNLDCFVSRVGAHPDRLENIYFDYAILVRAVTKLSGYLKDYEFCTGNAEEDSEVKGMVDRLIETSARSPAIFDEKAMFVGPEAQALKMEFRDHFRNITKIVSCVGCEKCRLWGKVQTSGLGTALKVLFSYNDEHLNPIKHPNLLQRSEIVALFNTFNRVSESVESIARFRNMYMETLTSGSSERVNRQHDDGNDKNNDSPARDMTQQPPQGSRPTRSVIQIASKAKTPIIQPSVSSSAGNIDVSKQHKGSKSAAEGRGSLTGVGSVRETLLELGRQPLGGLLWAKDHTVKQGYAKQRQGHGHSQNSNMVAQE
ncbi:hypothetical protein BGZ83_002674 [Gryganskiella cystojenkinii]|nr:hypothetical protein BGZ83_002674 [Gryganskiella cystojenkinii]